MSCPTCSHSMVCLGTDEGKGLKFFLCERCGTVKRVGAANPDSEFGVYVPKLVERCREYERREVQQGNYPSIYETWRRLGIEESIHRPEDR